MCQVNEKAEILTPHSSHIFQPILMKLEIKKISGIRPNMQNVVDVGRREGDLCRKGIFRYFLRSIYLSLFFCILAPAYRSHQKTNHSRLWLKTRVFAYGTPFWGSQ